MALRAAQEHLSRMWVVAAAILGGCTLIAWSIFFVGRRIARVLWGLLVVAEQDERQRAIYEEQERRLFR